MYNINVFNINIAGGVREHRKHIVLLLGRGGLNKIDIMLNSQESKPYKTLS